MADVVYPSNVAGYSRKLRDMGDGSHAEIVATEVIAAASIYLPAGTSRSGSITLGGTPQDLAAANASRQSLIVQNISAGDLWLNETGGSAVVDAAGSYKVATGATFSVATNQKVSVIGATTGQKFTATET